MIWDTAVFVLGAGASIPYGFPSGRELISRIASITKEEVRNKLGMNCEEVNSEMGFDTSLMLEFQVSLIRSQVDSIDTFLAHPKNDRFLEIGRFLIAGQLIPCEKKHVLVEDNKPAPNQSWYKLLWQSLLDIQQPEALSDLKLTFATFNYDRSLEQYLATVLNYGMHADAQIIKNFLQRNVFHVHGSLGEHPGMDSEGMRPYRPYLTMKDIRKAMCGIRITHEAASFPGRATVQERLRTADRIALLGFGYHRDNMQKLFAGAETSAKVLASAYGLTRLEASTARKAVADTLRVEHDQIVMGESGMGCYDFLRNHFEFG